MATDAWGVMGAGDTIVMETDSGAGGSVEYLNYSRRTSPPRGGLEKDRLERHRIASERGFTLSFLFRSTLPFRTRGFTLIPSPYSRSREGTNTPSMLTAISDNFGGNLCMTPIPRRQHHPGRAADPEPPSLHCRIFNKGYIDTTLRLFTEVSNSSWMSEFP